MKTRLAAALAVLVFAFFLISGCFTPNMKGPCCSKVYALNGTCELYTEATQDNPAVKEMCDGGTLLNGMKCVSEWCVFPEVNDDKNDTVYYEYGPSGSKALLNCSNVSTEDKTDPCNNIGYCMMIMTNETTTCVSDAGCSVGQCVNGRCGSYASYPVCTERAQLSYDTDCKTMLCGAIKYAPKTSLLPEPNKNVNYQNFGGGSTQNLYNAMCNFYVLDNVTMKKINRAKNVMVNTFRFGVGSSISDYEEARFYFPLSDRFCKPVLPGDTGGIVSYDIKDRFVDYLNLSNVRAEFSPVGVAYYGPFDPTTLTNRSLALGCNDGTVFPPTANGNYLMKTISEGDLGGSGTGPYIAHYLTPDMPFYKLSLYGAYWNFTSNNGSSSYWNYTSNTSAITTPNEIWGGNNETPADFECRSGDDCYSGICADTDYGYSRGFCFRNDTNTSANCLCHEAGTRGISGNEQICEPFKDTQEFTLLTSNVCRMTVTKPEQCCVTTTTGNGEDGITSTNTTCTNYQGCRLCSACSEDDYTCNANCCGGNTFPYTSSGECIDEVDSTNCTGDPQLAGNITFPMDGYAGYKGYAIMDESEFKTSMFYTRCGLTSADYAVYSIPNNVLPYDMTGSSAASAMMQLGCLASYSVTRYTGYGSSETVTQCTKSAKEVIGIKGFGKCAIDDGGSLGTANENFTKITNSFGWCDACTFSNMVTINLDKYWPYFKDKDFHCPGDGSTSPQVIGDTCKSYIDTYMENLGMIRKRVDAYLKAGVMPVVWYTASETGYTKTYSSSYNLGSRCDPIDTSEVTAATNDVLLSNQIYYPLDYQPFFENATSSCSIVADGDNGKCWGNNQCSIISSEGAGTGQEGELYSSPSGATGRQSADLGWGSWGGVLDPDKDCHYYACTWTAYYHFLNKAIGNSAVIVVVATDSMDEATIAQRAMDVKNQNCPNCLVALYSPAMNETKLKDIFGCDKGSECRILGETTDAWRYIDVILYDAHINNYMADDRDLEIYNKLTGRSREVLQLFGKPTMPYNFAIDDTSNSWNKYNDTFDAMKYLLYNQSSIVNSGLFALFYSNWRSSTSTESLVTPSGSTKTVKDEKFCAFQRAVDSYFYPPKLVTVFTEARAMNASEAQCVECMKTDQIVGNCNRTCENGIECELPSGVDASDADIYRCPGSTAIEPCRLCNDSYYDNANVSCNFSYSDGTYLKYVNRSIASLNGSMFDAYGDYVASMPKSERCCNSLFNNDTNGTYNYTYDKMSDGYIKTAPIRFPSSGNESLDCSLNAPDNITVCGAAIPVRDYKIECAIVRPS